MTQKHYVGGSAVSAVEIREIEQQLGMGSIPNDLREIWQNHDGAEFKKNFFRIGEENDDSVRRFISAKELERESSPVLRHLSMVPVAITESNSILYLGLGEQKGVFFSDYRFPDDLVCLKGTLSEFLESLLTPDEFDCGYDPDDVISVTGDPDFVPEFD